jgi:outer membrane lipoprotein carrier protein
MEELNRGAFWRSLRWCAMGIGCYLIALSQPSVRQAGAQNDLDGFINALQTKYNKLGALAADFTQVYNAPGERSRRESGRLLLKKPGKMRWDYTVPENKLFVSDGKWLYEYVAAEKLATRVAVKEADDLRSAFLFLLGRGNLRRDFKRIEWANESPVTAGHRVLRMVPKRGNVRELLVEAEPATLQLKRLVIINGNGGRSDFLFSNLRENPPTNDAQFTFTAPAGVHVVEQ